MASTQNEYSYEFQDYHSVKILYHGWCIDMVSPQNEYAYAFQDYLYVKILYHSYCIDIGFLQHLLEQQYQI